MKLLVGCDLMALFEVTEEVERNFDTCNECGGSIIRAEPVLFEGQSVGCEDGHYVCQRCGLITDQVLQTIPRNLSPIDRAYLELLPWGTEAVGGLLTHTNAREIIKKRYGREPKASRLEA